MEIEKGKAINGMLHFTFKDQFDEKCEMSINHDNFLRFAFEYVSYFSQEDMKQLLPYLQSFAETGTLEDATESPLQGVAMRAATLKMLDHCQDRIQKSQVQETKDSALCQVVVLLSQFAPTQVKEKAQDLLRTYNSEERIAPSPLQGEAMRAALSQIDNLIDESANLQDQLETMQEAGVATAANIVDQGKRIEALQNLVKEWQNTHGCACPYCYPDLHKKTAQFLGEE